MSHNMSPHQPRRCLSAVLVIVALTAGCHVSQPYEPTPPSVAAEALNVLRSLPSLEETQSQVQAVMDEITTAASQFIPTANWETLHEGSGGRCERPYEQTEGKRYFLPDAIAQNVDVSEQAWARLEQAAKTAAAKLEATEIQVMQDQPGNHDVGFYGPTGLFIKVGYRGNLVVSGYTGCRLPQDKK